jgi:hypothetical protein
LIERIENIIYHWCNRWLSRGGILTLVKSVLEAIPVYWHSLDFIPKGVLERFRKVCFNFLWGGRHDNPGIHLAK